MIVKWNDRSYGKLYGSQEFVRNKKTCKAKVGFEIRQLATTTKRFFFNIIVTKVSSHSQRFLRTFSFFHILVLSSGRCT